MLPFSEKQEVVPYWYNRFSLYRLLRKQFHGRTEPKLIWSYQCTKTSNFFPNIFVPLFFGVWEISWTLPDQQKMILMAALVDSQACQISFELVYFFLKVNFLQSIWLGISFGIRYQVVHEISRLISFWFHDMNTKRYWSMFIEIF